MTGSRQWTCTRAQLERALLGAVDLGPSVAESMAGAILAQLPEVPHKHHHPVNDPPSGTWLNPGPCACGMTQAETLAEVREGSAAP